MTRAGLARRLVSRTCLGGARGQAFTEYTMMLGLLAAIIIALTGIIVPGFGKIMVAFVKHVVVYVSSV